MATLPIRAAPTGRTTEAGGQQRMAPGLGPRATGHSPLVTRSYPPEAGSILVHYALLVAVLVHFLPPPQRSCSAWAAPRPHCQAMPASPSQVHRAASSSQLQPVRCETGWMSSAFQNQCPGVRSPAKKTGSPPPRAHYSQFPVLVRVLLHIT